MKTISYLFIASLFIAIQGCGTRTTIIKTTVTYNKKQTIMNVNKIIDQHRHDKLHSALALSVDKNDHYHHC